MAGLKLVFANWYVDPAHPAVEVSAGGSCTFSGRIEYPTGMFVDVTFRNGAPTGTAGDGETIVSDWVPIQIPIGKRFKVHVRLKGEGTYRVVYNLSQAHNPEDGMIFGAPSDSVILGDVFAPTGQDAVAPPLAIIGMTSRPSVLIVGDSVEAGSNDDNDNTGLLGPAARLLGSRIAYINVGRGGETSLDFVKGHSKRVALAQHVSHVLIGHGGNDIAAGFASPEITKRLETTASYFAGKTLLTLTEQPRTISSNGWNLDVNQKITQYEGTRQEVQRWKRGSGHPFDIVIDYADAVETAWNSGIWKVGYTDDGVHPTQAGSKAILSTGFDLNRIAPALPGDIEIPAITSSAKFSIAENTTTVATLAASEQGTWSIRGGPDASKFTIDPLTGTLKFANVPDHESPHDKRKNNVYNIDVRFTDHGGLFVGQKISVTVTDMPR
ncbi:hypothetical protein J4G37_30690 [Microvirga sp. 3-52]|nr:hypothetical protein [Microvirga sp. 3-52]